MTTVGCGEERLDDASAISEDLAGGLVACRILRAALRVDTAVDLELGRIVDVVERHAAQVGQCIAAGGYDLRLDRLERPAGRHLAEPPQVVLDRQGVDDVKQAAARLTNNRAPVLVITPRRPIDGQTRRR